jgi:tetratricopeptide (TPR) repeat protein
MSEWCNMKNQCINTRVLLKRIILLALFIPAILTAQDGDGQAGTRSFFDFGFGARAMGMGNAFTALADDPTAVYWNPAGLDYIYQQSVTLFHASLYEGALYDFLGYAYPTLDLGTFAIGIARLGIGDIMETNRINEELSSFSWEVYQGYFSYGLKLPWDLATGVSVKVQRSAWSGLVNYGQAVGVGVGMDLGFLYRPTFSLSPYLRDWSIGVNVENLFSPQVKEGDQADIIPRVLRFGVMRKIPFFGEGNSLNILLDLDKTQDTDLAIALGTEYSFMNMGRVRLGYNNNGIAFGAGVQYSLFQIDYAFGNPSSDGLLSPVHRISLSVNFGMNRDEMFTIVQELKRREEERIITEIREADKQRSIADHLQKADLFFKDKKYLDAVVEYREVINQEPFHQQAKIMLDSANVLLNQEIDARQNQAILAAIDKDRAEADRKFIEDQYEKGRIYLDKKQYMEALIAFNQALERDAENKPIKDAITTTQRRMREDINALVLRARQEFEKENYSEALRLLSEARLLSGDDPQVKKEVDTLVERVKLQENIQKGLMLYDIGQYEEALRIFESVLSQDPGNQFIRQYYTKSKIEALAETEKMDPETERRYLEGVDKFLLGRYNEAIEIWQEILTKHPYNKKVLEAISGAEERLKRSQNK